MSKFLWFRKFKEYLNEKEKQDKSIEKPQTKKKESDTTTKKKEQMTSDDIMRIFFFDEHDLNI